MSPEATGAQSFPPPCSPFQDVCVSPGTEGDDFGQAARDVPRHDSAQGDSSAVSEAGRAEVGLTQMWPNTSFPGDSVFSPKYSKNTH